MAHVVGATWVAKDGEEDSVAQILDELAPKVRAEPGCQLYIVSRAVDDPRTFFLFEQYDDEPAFLAHRETDHFQLHVLGEAVPLLESRVTSHYETLE